MLNSQKFFMKNIFLFISLLLLTFSCTDQDPPGGPFIEIYIEDSPAEFTSAVISLGSVELYDGTNWVTMNFAPSSVDIMQYSGGKSYKMVDQSIKPGSYSKLRITFKADGNKVFKGTESKLLTIDPAALAVELPVNLQIVEGRYFVMCDMDVEKSIDFDKATLKPSIAVIDLETAGALTGWISQKGSTAVAETILVRAESLDGSLRSSYTNSNGTFFVRLYEGEYSLYIMTKEKSTYVSDTILNVFVEKGQRTDIGQIELRIKAVPK